MRSYIDSNYLNYSKVKTSSFGYDFFIGVVIIILQSKQLSIHYFNIFF